MEQQFNTRHISELPIFNNNITYGQDFEDELENNLEILLEVADQLGLNSESFEDLISRRLQVIAQPSSYFPSPFMQGFNMPIYNGDLIALREQGQENEIISQFFIHEVTHSLEESIDLDSFSSSALAMSDISGGEYEKFNSMLREILYGPINTTSFSYTGLLNGLTTEQIVEFKEKGVPADFYIDYHGNEISLLSELYATVIEGVWVDFDKDEIPPAMLPYIEHVLDVEKLDPSRKGIIDVLNISIIKLLGLIVWIEGPGIIKKISQKLRKTTSAENQNS
jgi:hypothetical protein